MNDRTPTFIPGNTCIFKQIGLPLKTISRNKPIHHETAIEHYFRHTSEIRIVDLPLSGFLYRKPCQTRYRHPQTDSPSDRIRHPARLYTAYQKFFRKRERARETDTQCHFRPSEMGFPIPRRFLFYNDAFQKAEAIKKLQRLKDGILVGPSLTEGLDLKDDYCRFMILAKVPYPTLDEFNSKKMKLMPDWYGWKTTTSIIQALGRGIRHKTDWCVTYLMDSCFSLILQKQRIPRYVTSRITTYNIGNIQQKVLAMEDEMSGLFNYSESGTMNAPKPKETVDTIDVDAMLKTENMKSQPGTYAAPDEDKEEWDDLPF